jgi:hypothetical protein
MLTATEIDLDRRSSTRALALSSQACSLASVNRLLSEGHGGDTSLGARATAPAPVRRLAPTRERWRLQTIASRLAMS